MSDDYLDYEVDELRAALTKAEKERDDWLSASTVSDLARIQAEQRADALAALVKETIGSPRMHHPYSTWGRRAKELLEPQAGEESDSDD